MNNKENKRTFAQDIKLIIRSLSYLKRWPPYVFSTLVQMFPPVGYSLIMSSFSRSVVKAMQESNGDLLWRDTLIHAGVFIAWSLLVLVTRYIFNIERLYGNYNMRVELLYRMARYPYTEIDKNHTGDCMARLSGDSSRTYTLMGFGVLNFFIYFAQIAVASVTIFAISPLIGAILLLLGLIGLLTNTVFAKKIRPLNDRQRKLVSDQTAELVDMIAGSRLMKLFNFGIPKFDSFSKKVQESYETEMKEMGYFAFTRFVSNLLEIILNLGVTALGMWLVFTDNPVLHISLENMVFIMGMRWSLYYPLRNIGNIFMYTQSLLSSAQRVFEFMDKPVEELESDDTVFNTSLPLAVEFKNVGFSYTDNQPVFSGASFQVPAQSMTAVVGSSGAGKSTLFKLLLQFYQHTQGEIMLYNQEIKSCSLISLRNIIAYVPQTPNLFDFSIYENIRAGKLDATRDEIEAAAKAAYAHDFIMEMPRGYETTVGEMGSQLSGGQRQRIAIARAMLKNAPILLLDEATSSLDSESEHQVQLALDALMHGRTILVAAHRLSTIEHADNILVFDEGQVVQQGTHEQLLQSGGIYSNLYNIQFQN